MQSLLLVCTSLIILVWACVFATVSVSTCSPSSFTHFAPLPQNRLFFALFHSNSGRRCGQTGHHNKPLTLMNLLIARPIYAHHQLCPPFLFRWAVWPNWATQQSSHFYEPSDCASYAHHQLCPPFLFRWAVWPG